MAFDPTSTVRAVVVSDTLEPCPYLQGQTSRLPLRMPLEAVTPEAFEQMLGEGDRRFGPFFYRTACPSCSACEPIRVPIARFRATRSQRRVWRRNEGDVETEVVRPRVSERHLEIYNRHSFERGLARSPEKTTEKEYATHLMHTAVETREVRYSIAGKLVAFSILDFAQASASSVYHAFDPDVSDRSLGVYSVLKEIELCAARGLDWYYLGLYVGACKSLAYKAAYFPHQRRIAGAWHEFGG
jgi:arginine-tRNA-protein transferase